MNAVSFAESLGTRWTQCGALWQAQNQHGAQGKRALRTHRTEEELTEEVSLLPGETSDGWI